MPKDRALVWVQTKLFRGWHCNACRWEGPYQRLANPDEHSKRDARFALTLTNVKRIPTIARDLNQATGSPAKPRRDRDVCVDGLFRQFKFALRSPYAIAKVVIELNAII